MADSTILRTTDLRKRYGAVEALGGLNLHVPAGTICGFLGPNGAGKTTTIKVLLGMARPTSGQAHVFGLPADVENASVAIRQRTAFVSDEKDLFPYMTVDETIRFTAAFFPRWRGDLEQRYRRTFELPPGRRVRALSRGMRAKLALLLALCRGAELLILDEPTSGLDPSVREEVLQALVSQVAGGDVTVFFSSHHIADVEQIADHLVVIHRGRDVLAGATDEVRARFCRVQLVFDGEAPDAAFQAAGVLRTSRQGRVLTVVSRDGAEHIVGEARALEPISVDVSPLTLTDIFLEATAVEN